GDCWRPVGNDNREGASKPAGCNRRVWRRVPSQRGRRAVRRQPAGFHRHVGARLRTRPNAATVGNLPLAVFHPPRPRAQTARYWSNTTAGEGSFTHGEEGEGADADAAPRTAPPTPPPIAAPRS